MKKNKRHLYKRLPKYALGTMKPIDMGYQQARGIGSVKFDTELNMSLDPETQAVRKSALPNALGYITLQTPYVTEMLKSLNNATSSTTSATTNTFSPSPTMYSLQGSPVINGLNTTMLSQVAPKIATVSGLAPVSDLGRQLAATTGGKLLTGGEMLATSGAGSLSASSGGGLSTGAANTAKGAAGAGTSALGTTLGAIGTAIGGYTMANQIAGFGDHRNAGDMMANVGRQHITTDMGNSYTNYNGVNAGQEIAYENANTRAKLLGFGMNAIGTGASLGGMVGSIVPGLGNVLGAGIGAGVGLLLGGLGSLFGWGDNEDEVRRQISLANDNIAMYNRQQEAVAKSKDVAAEFSDRQGVATAAVGKSAFGPMTSKKGDNINIPRMLFDVNAKNNMSLGVPTSKLMPGETVLNKETSNWAVVPGKGEKDNVYSTVKPGDPNVVYTKKGGISKKAQAVLKSNASENLKRWQLNELEKEQSVLLMTENNQNDMKKYKNGKLPGFWRGTDYLMSAIPHLAALGSSWNLYNRAKYADMPDYPNIVDSSANTLAINILGRRRYNVDPILDNIHKNYRQYLYNVSHSGASAGQQAIERANAFIKKNEAQTQALAQADEINNKYTADYANALANYGKMMSEMMTNNNYARAAFKQQQNAAKEGWMAQYEKNGLTALADLASDIMGVRQFNRSEDYGDKMLKLYNQQVENDKVNAQATLANAMQARLDREAAYNKVVKEAIENTHPMFFNRGAFAPNNLNNLYGMFNYSLSTPTVKRYSWMR